MIAEIICVGTELLLGDILNTNAQYLSARLADLGVSLYYQTVVGDNEDRLIQTINNAKERSDLIILSGGLGPTSDDITKETVAKALNLPLSLNDDQAKKLEQFFLYRNIPMANNNLKQAFMPDGAIILDNNNGTAAGILIESSRKIFIILPGPPNELVPMFEESVVPYLRRNSNDCIVSRTLKLIGIGESSAAELVQSIIDKQTNPSIAPYAKLSEVHFRITARSTSIEQAQHLITATEVEMRKQLDKYIYTTEEKELEEIIVEILSKNNNTIAIAESCTGGLLSSTLINCSGVSEVFKEGLITYSNESKVRELGVDKNVIDLYGAVSKQVVEQMAIGIKNRAKTDIGIAISGIAGPTGGTEEKPVGLVYIAITYKNETFIKKLQLSGNRMKIRTSAAKQGLVFLYQVLKESDDL
ncbi:MAG: competence/damage-inducible protein A [Firmicutes bacterium HGW-Firmicutes-7]|nr:MAG: competence/damage-inducible protein A [Firmicutes bacterium HGW-Firmicutes-7]